MEKTFCANPIVHNDKISTALSHFPSIRSATEHLQQAQLDAVR